MGAVDAVFDTNILIDYMHGIVSARDEIALYTRPAISIMTWMEMMTGTTPATEAGTREFLSNFVQRPLSQKVAEIAVRLRRDLRLKLPDAVILATAEADGCLLITRDVKDFPAGHPRVRTPYTL